MPKWLGPATIGEVNESVAKIKLTNNKIKTFNAKRLKHFVSGELEDDQDKEDMQDDSSTDAGPIDVDPVSNKPNFDTLSNPSRLNTCAWLKLIKTDAATALIEQDIWYKLNNIAHKLYHLNLTLNQLTPQEEFFWKSFELKDIFEWLTGDPERPPAYQQYVTVRGSAEPFQQQQQAQQPSVVQQPQQLPPPQQPPQPGPREEAPK